MTTTRRLVAILAADVAGYSRLIGEDEEGTLERLKALRAELIDEKISEHRGRIVKTTGDGLLVEFSSVIDALRCASEWQREIAERNTDRSDNRIEFRIGVHQGDVVVEDGDIFGDGVNVAARLEGLADPGGICVSARVQEDSVGKLDLTFADMGEQSLKNIARPVRVYRLGLASESRPMTASTGPTPPALPLPDKPSIAVLAFQNMSADPEQEYFVDGMVEEIITALSRIRWLFVIARNSSFTYKGQAVDVKQVGRELGVRYVLEGSVRKAGQRVRITAQLIDAITGTHLWADRFDGSLEEVFDLQDNVASSVAGIIEPALQAAEITRSTNRPTNDLTAYDLYLRALPLASSLARERVFDALELLGRSIERDPGYGPAFGVAAGCRLAIDINAWSDDRDSNRHEGVNLARQALQLAGDDPGTLIHASIVLAYFGEDIETMMTLADRALNLNPSFAFGWAASAILRNWAGQPDKALEYIQNSMRLNPRTPMGTASYHIGFVHFFNRRFNDAATKFLEAIQERPDSPLAYRLLASCYAHMGRIDEAKQVIARVRAITPLVVPSFSHFRNPQQRALILAGLRLAAGETT